MGQSQRHVRSSHGCSLNSRILGLSPELCSFFPGRDIALEQPYRYWIWGGVYLCVGRLERLAVPEPDGTTSVAIRVRTHYTSDLDIHLLCFLLRQLRSASLGGN